MNKNLVAIFATHFPFHKGEPFLEPEIHFWSKLDWAKVVISPNVCLGQQRAVPADIDILPPIVNKPGILKQCQLAIRSFCSALFWREFGYMLRCKRFNFSSIVFALRATSITLLSKANMEQVVERYGHIDVAYCYWNSYQTYAACLLKREGKITTVVSRAHGSDLYEYRHGSDYIPLKRQFIDEFDRIYTVSTNGQQYLESRYNIPPQKINVSRLGVNTPNRLSDVSQNDICHIVSVSWCGRVKRIDRIIDAVATGCSQDSQLRISWVHIGSGVLEKKLKARALNKLNSMPNATFDFIGALPNSEVLAYYETHPVDVFINCSESEGIPVSIMEAMSYGIPAIAPAVGGITELVDNDCGVLLPPDFTLGVIADGIRRLTGDDQARYRQAARQRIVDHYNADTNFRHFIECIREVV